MNILSIDGASQVEDGFVVCTVRLSEAPTDAVTEDYGTRSVTATFGEDVRNYGNYDLFGTLTFAPNQQVQYITIYNGQDS